MKTPKGVVIWLAEPDFRKVAVWYETALPAAGWTQQRRQLDGDEGIDYEYEKNGKKIGVSVGLITEPKPDGHPSANALIVVDTTN